MDRNHSRSKGKVISARLYYVFIDCPPSLGFLTVNALLTAPEVYIPIAMTYLRIPVEC
jgi:chromosome partitioning protein